ncbi:beta-galactosidase [Kitasatospora paracochleata]|uniref:Beta-galactosidase n=1 Tax=Kitasatospora paracochleata TaxID=58354 RepID=A0ABT1JAF5_9ACTN|nr:beta-galactosidase [Kitasatospora paracochleata]MCP2314194.1 beta-galactosidase [Kitasatospora paracochleata]
MIDRLLFGGDYNPEQWPDSVVEEDLCLMAQAGVTLLTVGVFSWALLEPKEECYRFDWLDQLLDRLHGAGICVDLATPTAAPPQWFSRAYPASLPVDVHGHRLAAGSRLTWCPSSPDYRRAAVRIAGELAERYSRHPAVRMWHVGNELGCKNMLCYCETSAAAFRAWLQERYSTLEALNEAWGTVVWSQTYGSWEEVQPPLATASWSMPAQELDFRRFSSDAVLEGFKAERDAIRQHSDLPVTTNFMAASFKDADYFRWARELDVVSNDHYLRAEDPDNHVDLALAADLSRGLGGGAPWILMEHSTSAVSWQPRNLAKGPGELRRNSLAHVARGADAVCFFQWRASVVGPEKFHSAMLQHAGTDTRVWREVCELGRDIGRLAPVAGTRVEAEVAMLWDYEAWWALELDGRPSRDIAFLSLVREWYAALWRLGITVDLVHPSADLSGYRMVVAPSLYLTADDLTDRLSDFVAGGGTAVVGFFSGISDENDRVRTGGYPGAFRDLLGVRVEEFHPHAEGAKVVLDDGAEGRIWSEHLHLAGASTVTAYAEGFLAGQPAITRHAHGEGCAWYLSTLPTPARLAATLAEAAREAGVRPPVVRSSEQLEIVRRTGAGGSYLFLINHGNREESVQVAGTDLLTGVRHNGELILPAGAVSVVRVQQN